MGAACIAKSPDSASAYYNQTQTDLANASVVYSSYEISCRTVLPKLRFNRSVPNSTKLVAEWKKSNVLSALQSHVLTISSIQSASIEELSRGLTEFGGVLQLNEVDISLAKAYVLYYWIVTNISYDGNPWIDLARDSTKATSSNVQETVSEGFATLFQVLATRANLNTVLIRGHERAGRIPSRDFSTHRFAQNEENAHAWNAVEIDGAWVLLDCSYGPRSIYHGWQTIDCLSEYYFAVPPEQMIYTHWPEDHSWQLLEKPVTFSDIELLVTPHAGVFALGICAVTCCEEVELKADLPSPVVHIELKVPSSLHLSASLTKVQGTPGLSNVKKPPKNDFLTYVHQEEKEEENVNVYAVCPAEGDYFLNIFAHSPLLKFPMFCFSYHVINQIPKNDYCCLPVVYNNAAAFNFKLYSWNDSQMPLISKNLTGKMNIRFKVAQNVRLKHYIVHASNPSKALYYYTHLTRDKSDPLYCLMQVVFPENGWWNIFIWCSSLSASSSDFTLKESTLGFEPVTKLQMYSCVGIRGQTYPWNISPNIRFESDDPISATDGEVLKIPFLYSGGDTLEAYISRESTLEACQQMADYTVVESLTSSRYLLHAVLPQSGTWEIFVIAKDASEVVFQLLIEVNQGLKNTVFPCLFSESALMLGIELVNLNPLTYSSDGSILLFIFKGPDGLEFQHGIVKYDSVGVPKVPMGICDYYTYLQYPSSSSKVYQLFSTFPSPGIWSVVLFARKGSTGEFYQILSINHLEIEAVAQVVMCYPKLSPSCHGIGIPASCLPFPSIAEEPEFKLPFTAPGFLYFSCSMNTDATEKPTVDHIFVHKIETGSYLLHIAFPKPGTWTINVNAVRSADVEDLNFFFQLKLTAKTCLPSVCFPQVFEPFYATFKMSTKGAQFPLPHKVTKVPTTLSIPFYSPGDVIFWHLAQVDEVVHEAATQILSLSEPSKYELVVEITKSGKWVVTLYAQHAYTKNKTDWTPVLRHSLHVE